MGGDCATGFSRALSGDDRGPVGVSQVRSEVDCSCSNFHGGGFPCEAFTHRCSHSPCFVVGMYSTLETCAALLCDLVSFRRSGAGIFSILQLESDAAAYFWG